MRPDRIVTTDGVTASMPHALWDECRSRIAELEAALRPFAALGAAVRFIDDTGHVTLRVRADVLRAAQKAMSAKALNMR